MINCFDVAGTMAQATFGEDKADTGISFFPEKGKIQRRRALLDQLCVLLNKAKNPQGTTDFFLYMFGPDNKATGKQITQMAAKPCYQYTSTSSSRARRKSSGN